MNLRLFVAQLFANRIRGFVGWDVIVSSLALWVLVFSEVAGPALGTIGR